MLARIVRQTWVQTRSLQTTSVGYAKRLPKGGIIMNKPVDVLIQEDDTEDYLDKIGEVLAGDMVSSDMDERQASKKSNKQLQREKIKRQIQYKKEKAFYTPKPPALLTWAAKMQIIYLNKTDPIYWTPEMLATSFPVTRDGVIQIIRSHRIPINEAEIVRHDQRVYNTWLRLRQVCKMVEEGDETGLDENDRWLADYGKKVLHLLPSAAGDKTQTIPPSEFAFRTQEQIAEENKPVVKPYFSTILTSYNDDKERLKGKLDSKETPIGFEEESIKLLLQGIADLGQLPVGRSDSNEHTEGVASDSYPSDKAPKSQNAERNNSSASYGHGKYTINYVTALESQQEDEFDEMSDVYNYTRKGNQFNGKKGINMMNDFTSDQEYMKSEPNRRSVQPYRNKFETSIRDQSTYQQHTDNRKKETNDITDKLRRFNSKGFEKGNYKDRNARTEKSVNSYGKERFSPKNKRKDYRNKGESSEPGVSLLFKKHR